MKITLKINSDLLVTARKDLRRPHPFAFERVGFFRARCTRSARGLLVLTAGYSTVPDQGYLEDHTVGAMIDQETIHTEMQRAYAENVSIIHAHLHEHAGRPTFSATDLRESRKFMPSFSNVRPEYPHLAIVLSADSVVGLCWPPGRQAPVTIDRCVVVGSRLHWVLS